MLSLTDLPTEAIQHIAFFLAAHHPQGPPHQLTSFRLASKAIAHALDHNHLLASLFFLKFDSAAAARRLPNNHPPTSDALARQLKAYCYALRVLRTGDPFHHDAPHALYLAFLMMLDNDGKNYAQLCHVNVHLFLRRYLLNRLWSPAHLDPDGWPRDSPENSAALWLLWLTTERRHLVQESVEEREAVIARVLPFVVLTQRYPASEAPPNHFSLPLPLPSRSPLPGVVEGEPNPNHKPTALIPIVTRTTTTTTTAEGTKIVSTSTYPHYLPPRAVPTPYFDFEVDFCVGDHSSDQHTTPPPAPKTLKLTLPIASIPAKLLFISRRELRPVTIPAHVPPGPNSLPPGVLPPPTQAQAQGPGPLTRDDYHELNRAKAALLPRGARWDWEVGRARGVNPEVEYVVRWESVPVPGTGTATAAGTTAADAAPAQATTQTQTYREVVCEIERPLVWIPIPSSHEDGDGDEDGDDDSESRKWDTTFWRAVRCGDFRFRGCVLGEVYRLGSMDGRWRGKIYIPQAAQYTLALQNPLYPSVNDEIAAEHGQLAFSENSLRLVMQPVCLEVGEHWRVCLCSSSEGEGEKEKEEEQEDGEEEDGEKGQDGEECGCGIIPTPQPQVVVLGQVQSAAIQPLVHVQGQQQQQAQHTQHQHNQVVPLFPISHPGPGSDPGSGAGSSSLPQSPLQQQNQNQQNQNQNAPYDPLDPSTHPSLPDAYKAFPSQGSLDTGMSNAWFEGPVGGVSFVLRDDLQNTHMLDARSQGMRDQVVFATGYKVPDRRVGDGEAYCVGVERCLVGSSSSSPSLPSSGSGSGMGAAVAGRTPASPTLSSSSASSQEDTPAHRQTEPTTTTTTKKRPYVYETYDPSRMSTHDALFGSQSQSHHHHHRSDIDHPTLKHKLIRTPTCASCEHRERARLEEKKRREGEDERALLERFMAAVRSSSGDASSGSNLGKGKGMEVDLERERDEEMEMDDLDMDAFGADEIVRCVERGVQGHLRRRERDEEGVDVDVDVDVDMDDARLSDNDEEEDDEEEADEGEEHDEEEDATDADTDTDTSDLSSGSRKRKRVPGPSASESVLPRTGSGTGTGFAVVGGRRKRVRRREPRRMSSLRSSGSGSGSGSGSLGGRSSASASGSRSSGFELEEGQHEDDGRSSGSSAHSNDNNNAFASTGKSKSTAKYIRKPKPKRAYTDVPCRGVKDIVLTGDTGTGFRIYQAFTFYGRVRRWDGLVGILRVSRGGPDAAIAYLFIFGYVVGERNFVGEWRMAASDPLRPTWGSAFVLSKS